MFGKDSRVKFRNQTLVKKVEPAKYLGCLLNKFNDTTREVRCRIRDATVTLKWMHTFWCHSNCSIKFKLNVLQAVLFAKVLFGMESAELTEVAIQALDVFHLRGLRKILRMKTTFIDRANTNEEVYKRANEHLKEGKHIEPLSAIYLRRKQRFTAKS